jgi:hypothetical protein
MLELAKGQAWSEVLKSYGETEPYPHAQKAQGLGLY